MGSRPYFTDDTTDEVGYDNTVPSSYTNIVWDGNFADEYVCNVNVFINQTLEYL